MRGRARGTPRQTRGQGFKRDRGALPAPPPPPASRDSSEGTVTGQRKGAGPTWPCDLGQTANASEPDRRLVRSPRKLPLARARARWRAWGATALSALGHRPLAIVRQRCSGAAHGGSVYSSLVSRSRTFTPLAAPWKGSLLRLSRQLSSVAAKRKAVKSSRTRGSGLRKGTGEKAPGCGAREKRRAAASGCRASRGTATAQ